jgi:tellurite resistance protein
MTRRLNTDEAVVALCIAAMDANGHTSPAELERANHLIWSTRRFRHQDGDAVDRIVSDMRTLVETSDADHVLGLAVRAIPPRLRAPAFAVLADLLLVDGRLDAQERAFVRRIGTALKIDPLKQRRIVDTMLVKNSL